MDQLLRFIGAVVRDPAIDRWFAGRPQHLGALAREWFEIMRECGDDVRELIHDGCPVACVEDAPFASVNTYSAHVNVGFFQGAELPDPAGLLKGAGKRMRHVKLNPEQPINAAALSRLIDVAYADIKARLSAVAASSDDHASHRDQACIPGGFARPGFSRPTP